MRIVAALALGLACAIIVACGGAQKSSAVQASAPPLAAPPGGSRMEIEELDRIIEQDLAELGLPTSQPPACAEGGCPGPTAQQLSTGITPPSADQTCKRSQSDVCQSSCTLSDSICTNAKRICVLADDLGGNDAFANEKCARGSESCEKSRTKCCGCL